MLSSTHCVFHPLFLLFHYLKLQFFYIAQVIKQSWSLLTALLIIYPAVLCNLAQWWLRNDPSRQIKHEYLAFRGTNAVLIVPCGMDLCLWGDTQLPLGSAVPGVRVPSLHSQTGQGRAGRVQVAALATQPPLGRSLVNFHPLFFFLFPVHFFFFFSRRQPDICEIWSPSCNCVKCQPID